MDELQQFILTNNENPMISMINFLCKYMKSQDNERIIIITINNLLLNTKTRSVGLELMNAVIQKCSRNTVMENASNWLSSCVVLNKNNEYSKILKLKITEKLIRAVGEEECFSKTFISDYLLDTVKTCLTYDKKGEMITCLKCLSRCMEKYPDCFNNQKENVEKFLTKFLETTTESNVEEAAVAFHYFLQTGNAGREGINYVNNFRNQFRKLCNTVLNLYDMFFKDMPTSCSVRKSDNEVFILSEIPADIDDKKKLEVIADRILHCLIFMKIMIQKKFPVAKQIFPKQVITIFKQGFLKHDCHLQASIFLNVKKQSWYLNEIQLQLFRILQVFMSGNASTLLPFSHILIKNFLDILEQSSICIYCINDLSYREKLYNTISYCLHIGNTASNVYFQEKLIFFLLNDITPNETKKVLNKYFITERKTSLTSNLQRSVGERSLHCNNITQEKRCLLALNVLTCLMKMSPLNINRNLWQELMSSILGSLNDTYIRKKDIISQTTILMSLYKVLILLLKQEHMKPLPSMHLVISLLKKGLSNVDCRVSNIACEGLKFVEALSQSICYSLCLNLNANDYLGQYTVIYRNKFNGNTYENNEAQIDENSVNGIFKNHKEINIISNITIAASDDNRKKKLLEMKNDKIKSNITDVNTDVHSCSKKEEDTISEKMNNEKKIVVERLNTSEQPPEKKIKAEDCVLKEMISSFQDIV